VLPLLVGLDHSVTAVVHRPQSRTEIERAGAVPVQVDLFARDAIRKAVAGHDAVINLATHLPQACAWFLPRAWAENDRIRRIASTNLVDAAIAGGATRFIQESFAPAYPDRGEAWIDERTPIAPVRYNRSVFDAERSAQRFSSGGRTGVVLRFAAFYGPDSWFTRDLIRYIRRGFVPIPSAVDSYISSVSHDDAASAVMGALVARAGAYNVVDDEPMRRREFFGSLAEVLGVPVPRLAPPKGPGRYNLYLGAAADVILVAEIVDPLETFSGSMSHLILRQDCLAAQSEQSCCCWFGRRRIISGSGGKSRQFLPSQRCAS
jgi:2-alkyl-3-oxoalkanoate reductase